MTLQAIPLSEAWRRSASRAEVKRRRDGALIPCRTGRTRHIRLNMDYLNNINETYAYPPPSFVPIPYEKIYT